jgi:hypothetical protein
MLKIDPLEQNTPEEDPALMDHDSQKLLPARLAIVSEVKFRSIPLQKIFPSNGEGFSLDRFPKKHEKLPEIIGLSHQ